MSGNVMVNQSSYKCLLDSYALYRAREALSENFFASLSYRLQLTKLSIVKEIWKEVIL